MQCQMCPNAATVHLTEIVNGQKKERHLCESCAEKEGITVKAHVPLSELLGTVVAAQKKAEELNELRCPHCGITWTEFRRQGSLGCAQDYTVFEATLRPLIEKAQAGAASHIGHVPRQSRHCVDVQGRMLKLRQDLRLALSREDYETAARLRDELGHLTGQQHE